LRLGIREFSKPASGRFDITDGLLKLNVASDAGDLHSIADRDEHVEGGGGSADQRAHDQNGVSDRFHG